MTLRMGTSYDQYQMEREKLLNKDKVAHEVARDKGKLKPER